MTSTSSKWIPATPRPIRELARLSCNGDTPADADDVDDVDDVDGAEDILVETRDASAVEDNVEVEEQQDGAAHDDAVVECDTSALASDGAEREAADTAQGGMSVAGVVKGGVRIFALIVVAFVLFALVLSGLAQGRSQVGLQRRFRVQLASNSAPVGGAIPIGAPIAVVEIRAIGLHEAVVEGSRSSQLRMGPGHVVGTPLPGQPGNAVVVGRRTLYGGPFSRLGSLHPGDLIHITTGEGNTTYRVANVSSLGVRDGSFVQNHGDNRLTLFTTDSPWAADGRLVVTATLLGNALPPTVLPRTLDADGLGLTGERDSAPNLLVWLEILAVAVLVATFARSRWSSVRVWLVFAPAVALLVWLFFESAVRLLPATL